MIVKKIFKNFCAITLVGMLFSSTVFAATGTVTGNSVRIREKADSNSIEVSLAKKGEQVEVIGQDGNWYHVKFENVTGYISKDYVDTDYSSEEILENSTESQETSTNSEVTVNSENNQENNSSQSLSDTDVSDNILNNKNEYQKGQSINLENDVTLRYLPSFTSRVQIKIEKGSTCNVQASLNNWVKISNDNNYGWILKNEISGLTSESVSEDLVLEETEQTSAESATTEPISTVEEPTVENQVAEDTSFKGVVNVKSAVLRKSPNGEKIDSLPNGTEVTVLSEENDWYKIKTDEYDSCYIAKRLITRK